MRLIPGSLGDQSGRAAILVVSVLLALLTLTTLGGVVQNGFVNFDDDLYITSNPNVTAGSGVDRLVWAFTTTRGGNWHPVTWISHLVDIQFFGMNSGAHHAVGLAIHTANALLLLALLHGLTGVLWPSAIVAAIFAVHPLHVESVAWAAERKDLLSTFFALCAALAYVRFLRRPGRIGSGVVTPLLFALALMAKPMPLTLPLLLLLLDWWPLNRWTPFPVIRAQAEIGLSRRLPPWRLWREKAPLLLLSAGSGVVTWIVQSASGAMTMGTDIPLPARAANAATAYVGYLRKALWPLDLAVFYPYPRFHRPLAAALALALLFALATIAMRQARRRPWLAVGLLWYFVCLIPVIGLVQVGEQAMADRYTYLPLVGVLVAAAWGLAEIAGLGRQPAQAVTVALLLAVALLCTATSRQVGTWRDGVTLFSHALAVTEGNYIAHNNLGTELLRRGRAAEARPHFEATIRLAPDSSKGYQNLGRSLAQQGIEEAVDRSRQAVARDPDDPVAHRSLGQALDKLGRREEALASYRELLRLQPRDPDTLDLVGVALARAGRPGEAVPLLEAATVLAPGDPSIGSHLAVARAQLAAIRAGDKPVFR